MLKIILGKLSTLFLKINIYLDFKRVLVITFTKSLRFGKCLK